MRPLHFVLAGAWLILCSNLVWAEIRITQRQPVEIVRTNGFRIVGTLISLDSKRVKYKPGNSRNTRTIRASDVRFVKTRTDTYVYNPKKSMFEKAANIPESRQNSGRNTSRTGLTPQAWLEAARRRQEEAQRKRTALNEKAQRLRAEQERLSAEEKAKARQQRIAQEARRRAPVTVVNSTNQKVSFVVKGLSDEEGNEVPSNLHFQLEPGETRSLKDAAKPITTSVITYSLRNLHGSSDFHLSNPNPGEEFPIIIKQRDLPLALLVRVLDGWTLQSQIIDRGTVRKRTKTRLIAETEFFSGKKTGNFRVEGGEEYEEKVEERRRYLEAYATVENPTNAAMRVTATVRFYYQPELSLLSGNISYKPENFTESTMIPPRTVARVTVVADISYPITGAAKAFSALLSGTENPLSYRLVKKIEFVKLTNHPVLPKD